MGNQLTGIAPSQILPVEHYLTDIPDFYFDTSLGSTRFFKVARAKGKEGLAVVKVFVIHDPSLPLATYEDHLNEIQNRLQGAANCLPFQKSQLSDKAALLYRQYVKDSLYDRISTRPFLSSIEKKWLAFQLLCGLNQCHKLGVCHGDIKSENVMVTSWTWLLLTDFASFKPTYLPEDNPADFSYFFDTSRRRTCYISPERFVESSWRASDPASQPANIELTSSEVKKGDLTPAMDIFSAGCVITELFTEGTPPFDLSQLLSYRTGEYAPHELFSKIEDYNIRVLVEHMTQRDFQARDSAEEYLIQQQDKAFPKYFYTFLKLYLQRFASSPIMDADDRITRIKRDLSLILKNLNINEDDPSDNSCLVIVISLITATLRSLKFCSTKLMALEVMLKLSKYVTSDVILDRLLPYMLHLVNDPFPAVRCEAVHTITQCLASVRSVPVNDANVFPEYILSQLGNLTQDNETIVRVAYAENIALLAETALRFLEIVQLSATDGGSKAGSDTQGNSHYRASYDMELQALHEMVQQKVVTLLSDHDNIVKETLLQNGITRLCVFFGRQKANDVLLSHTITFLNDKYDWHLRASFFDAIIGIATYVGWQSSSILKPLLQQGLSDTEDYVIYKTLCTVASLTELSLLQKPILQELLTEVVPLLCHPNLWIRQGTVGFVSAMARNMNLADVHCHLMPVLQFYLKQPVIQLDQEMVLLNALKDPIPRPIYDYVLRCVRLEQLFSCLQDRQLIRSICRPGHQPNYGCLDENLVPVFRKLSSQGLNPADEEKLLALKDFMLKIHKARAGSSDSSVLEEESHRGGSLNLAALGRHLTIRHADLYIHTDPKLEASATPARKPPPRKVRPPESPSSQMNEDWKAMFGSSEMEKSSVPVVTGSGKAKPSPQQQSSQPQQQPADTVAVLPPVGPQLQLQPPPLGGNKEVLHTSQVGSSGQSSINSLSQSTVTVSLTHLPASLENSNRSTSERHRPTSQARYAQCRIELRNLIYKKRDQYSDDQISKEMLDSTPWDMSSPPAGWRPKGQLVAHLHEHRGAVNRIQVSPDNTYFASCSNDGTVKLWDCSRMEGKSVTNRSRHTYNKQGGQIKTITFCDSTQCVAAASDSGAIHVFRIENSGQRVSILHTNNLDVETEGLIVDMCYFDTGSQNVVCYSTVHGRLVGWDLRTPKVAWKLQNDPKQGLITSFDVHRQLSWLCLGTSSGIHTCWDLRFQLPITSVSHPTGARVRRLVTHTREQSSILSAVQGNNEVSLWDMETGARQRTLWASPAPPLSMSQVSSHSVNGMYLSTSGSQSFLLTAGSDMRIRFWDLLYPAKSFIMANAASDPPNGTVVSHRTRLIEGTEVIQETYSAPRSKATEDSPRRGPDHPAEGHHDIISDVALCQTAQCFVITSSRDGVVKVWK